MSRRGWWAWPGRGSVRGWWAGPGRGSVGWARANLQYSSSFFCTATSVRMKWCSTCSQYRKSGPVPGTRSPPPRRWGGAGWWPRWGRAASGKLARCGRHAGTWPPGRCCSCSASPYPPPASASPSRRWASPRPWRGAAAAWCPGAGRSSWGRPG